MATQEDVDGLQTQVYILAGVFGGTTVFLILAVTILWVLAHSLKKQIRDDANRRKMAEEMNTRRFSAYTGEEIQRQLTAATVSAAIPLPSYQSPPPPVTNITSPVRNEEYAFNTPDQGHGLYTLQDPRKY